MICLIAYEAELPSVEKINEDFIIQDFKSSIRIIHYVVARLCVSRDSPGRRRISHSTVVVNSTGITRRTTGDLPGGETLDMTRRQATCRNQHSYLP